MPAKNMTSEVADRTPGRARISSSISAVFSDGLTSTSPTAACSRNSP
jgi:hypothetical protein